jgi:hypothetical protein
MKLTLIGSLPMICSNEVEIVVFLEDMVYMVILMVSIKL